MADAVVLEDVRVQYAGRQAKEALRSLNLTMKRGEIFGFLGPNGAGKTTAIKTILGLIPRYEGRVEVLGSPPHESSHKYRIGYMPEIANYYWYLTPVELLFMYAGIFGIEKKAATRKIGELIGIVDLRGAENTIMKTFSKGMMQKVNFAQALINDPELLVLDEPTSGLDPVARIRMRDVIKSLRNAGKTIFFSSHELSEAEMISDEIAVIKDGSILKSGRTAELLARKGSTVSLERFFLDIIGAERKAS